MLDKTERLNDEKTAVELEDVVATKDDEEIDALGVEVVMVVEEMCVENALAMELLDRAVEEVRVEDWPALLEGSAVLHLPYPF